MADTLSKLQLVDCGVASMGHCREDLFRRLEQAYEKQNETKELLENLGAYKEFCVIQNKIYYTKNG